MKMKDLVMLCGWVVVLGGLLWGYKGLTGGDLLAMVLGMQVANLLEIVVGLCALVVGYGMLTMKKGKK